MSRASLHNQDEIAVKDIRIGDTVLVERAGDAVPDIVKVIPSRRTGIEQPFVFPRQCPVCGSQVVHQKKKPCTDAEILSVQPNGSPDSSILCRVMA